MPSSSDEVTLDIAVVETRLRKPPLSELVLSLEASNRASAPRWVLVPRSVAHGIGERGVDVLEAFEWTGEAGRAVIGSFQGTGGFFAIHLGPGATVRLHGLAVRWFRQDDAPPPALGVVVAHGVDVGGRPAAAWFPAGDPVVTGTVVASRGQLVDSVRFAPDSAEMTVTLTGTAVHPIALETP